MTYIWHEHIDYKMAELLIAFREENAFKNVNQVVFK